MARYSFEDWLNGEPENWNGNPMDGYDFSNDQLKVFHAKIKAFEKIVEINVVWITRFVYSEISRIDDPNDHSIFLNKQIEIYESRIKGISRTRIINGPHEYDLKYIDANLYLRAKEFKIPEEEEAFQTILVPDEFINATIAHKVIREIEKLIEQLGSGPLRQNQKPVFYEKFSGVVRYLLLDEFFTLKKSAGIELEKQKVKLISIILDKDIRTARGYKNGETKYFNSKNEDEAQDLINKIKKGHF